MIPFDEIDSRLHAIGKNRAWLAEVTGRSAGSIRSALAPKAEDKHRSSLLQKALSDAIEREEQAAAAPPPPPLLPDRITLEVHPTTMERWNSAAASQGETTRQWAISELNRAAEAWHATQARSKLKLAEDPTPYRTSQEGSK